MSPSSLNFCGRLGYRFSHTDLLETALTHRSCGARNNERLEFLGDAVLSTVVSEALYLQFPTADEGALSRLRANLVKGETLAAKARELDIGAELQLGPGELKSGGYRRASILAGAFEAVLGAVYLDGGFGAARSLILALFAEELAEVSVTAVGKDPKTRLQEYLQARHLPLPEYRVTGVAGHDHAQIFRVECRVEGLPEVAGEGGSRRKAEQDAAARALERLGQK